MAVAVNKKGANWVLSLWTNAAGSAFWLMAHYNDAYLAGLRTHQIFSIIIGPNGSGWLFIWFFFFTAYCLFTLPLYCARGALKVTASWHGHDNMTDSKAKAAICMRLERLQARRPEDFGVCFPCSICHFVNRKEKKEGKNHAAEELIKVLLAQVSHKVAGARDGRLFTGTADPKRFTRTRGSAEKLNERMLLPGECAMKFGSTADQQAISWGSDLCVWPLIFLVTCRISSRVLLFERPVTWNDVEGFNRTCVCLFKSQLQVFPDQLLSYMMIQAN